jgi:hypothetical protein
MLLSFALVVGALGISFPIQTVLAASASGSSRNVNNNIVEREHTFSANARWEESRTIDGKEVLILTEISILKTTEGRTVVGMSISTVEDPDGVGGETVLIGRLNTTTEDVFTIDKALSKAILSPVKVELCNENDLDPSIDECTTVERTMTVQAVWSGIGKIFHSFSKSISENENGRDIELIQTRSRTASATGQLDGENLGKAAPDSVALTEFRMSFLSAGNQ